MLILFDIDGTLIRTDRAGVQAMQAAAEAVFGRPFSVEAINFAGSLDPVIFHQLLRSHDIEPSTAAMTALAARYRVELRRCLDEPGRRLLLLPGVQAMVERLTRRVEWALGLLTGNFSDTGRMKVEACGLDTRPFRVNAFGDDADPQQPSRRDLPPVAMRRHRELLGRAIDPRQVLIIGDTPADIDCARANGCRVLAVATGRFDVDELLAHEPDRAVPDLGAVDEIIDWMASPRT